MQTLQSERSDRPWGNFIQFTKNQQSTVKIIRIDKKRKTSLQVHKNRDEFWRVLSGVIYISVNGETKTMSINDEVYIKAGQVHRIECVDDAEILEISFGDFDENDITRLNDDYGRSKNQ